MSSQNGENFTEDLVGIILKEIVLKKNLTFD
jgi:hypothetical protein